MASEDQLTLRYVPLSTAVEWDWVDNPKLHDTGGIIQSIQEYGYRSPSEYDATLGAFAQGNGRVKALALMQLDSHYERPRYIGVDRDSGDWAVPVLFGADSKSAAAAKAYAIDCNSLVVTGGDTEIWDILALYDQQQLAEITAALGDQGLVTLDDDSIALLRDAEEVPDPQQQERWTFQVHFDAPRALLDELQGLIGPYFMPRSRRKLMPEFFTAMVRAYCEDRPVVVTE